jgi:hypothetical protein
LISERHDLLGEKNVDLHVEILVECQIAVLKSDENENLPQQHRTALPPAVNAVAPRLVVVQRDDTKPQ